MRRALEIRPEQILFDVDGKLVVTPNSTYYTLKYINGEGERIAYDFGNGMKIQETYDARIFNCDCNGQRFQFRQDLSDRLCQTIIDARAGKGCTAYEELFKYAMREVVYWDVLHHCLAELVDVKFGDGEIRIGEFFKVDNKGNAWYYETGKHSRWRSLCIVMKGRKPTTRLISESRQTVDVNLLTMTIIAKVLFLAAPNMNDRIFTSQLPEEVRISLIDDSPTIGSRMEEVKA